MRFAVLAALTGVAVLFQAAPSPAQKAGRSKADAAESKAESTAPQVSEIGGKSLDEWIAEIGAKDPRSVDPSRCENAIRTVVLFPPEQAKKAVPDLIKVLKSHSITYPLDLSVRLNATIGLAHILSSIPDPPEKQVKEAVTQIKRMLTDTTQDIGKCRAAQALAQIGPEAKVAIPTLLYTLKDRSNWETRVASAAALGRLAMPAPPRKGKKLELTTAQQQELDKVIQGLSDRAKHDISFQVRLTCLHSLVGFGKLGGKVAKQVMDRDLDYCAAKDPDPSVRIWAQVCIMAMGKIEPKRLTYIGSQLRNSKDPQVRIQAAQALGTMGADAAPQIPRLVQALDDPDRAVASASLAALAQMGKEGQDELGKALAGAREAVIRGQAALALGKLGPEAKAQIPRLVQALDDPDKGVGAAALLALAQMGEPGVEEVGKVLGQSKLVATVRSQAAEALGSVGPRAKSQLAVLAGALGDTDTRVVSSSLWALAQMGKAAEPVLPRVQQLARGKDVSPAVQQMATAVVEVIEGRGAGKVELKKGPR